jgi:general secretion pathway protein H
MLKERARGFTLLEVVVVLAITAILFSFAVLAIGDGGRKQVLEHEGKRLKAICELAAQMAILQGQEIGAVFGQTTYGFVNYQDGQWQTLQDDRVLRQRSLPDGLQIHIAAEGRLLQLNNQLSSEVDPQVIFFSNGEISPFEIHFTDAHSTRSLRLTGSLIGALELSEVECAIPGT